MVDSGWWMVGDGCWTMGGERWVVNDGWWTMGGGRWVVDDG